MTNDFDIDISDLYYLVNNVYDQWNKGKIKDKEAREELIYHCKTFLKYQERSQYDYTTN